MFYVGIDVAKFKHDLCLLDKNGTKVGKEFSFANSQEGADQVLAFLEANSVTADNLLIGMEATGHYWIALYSFLFEHGYHIIVINPIQTDSYRRMAIRKVKNDQVDAYFIAKLLRSGDFKQSSAMDERYTGLKQLTRFRMFLVDECSDLKKKALVILDQVFPEYQKLFTDTFGKTSTEILLNCPFPEDIQQISTRKLITLLNKASRGRLGASQAETLKKAAANSFGITFATDAFAFELKQLLQQLLFTEKQIADLDTQIAKQLKTLDTYITSIPGIGEVLGATIISEIGDINTFEAPNKLVAFAGIDASVHSSGTFVGTQNHMSKRGSPYLRRAIWLAASVAAFHDPILSAYYQQLRARGKHHLVAINGVARKLCNIIYTILKEQRAYLPLPPKGR